MNATFHGISVLVLSLMGSARVIETPPPPPRVSMTEILARPASFRGRQVVVEGWCYRATEEAAIYLSKDDVEFMTLENSIWLDGDISKQAWWKERVAIRCVAVGRVQTGPYGHLNRFRLSLIDVKAIYIAKSRADYAVR